MTVVVTGGTKGIGLAIAERLARPGEPLVLAYRSDDAAAEAAKARLAPTGADVFTVRADVGEIDGAAAVMAAAADRAAGPMHLVHSAAMIYPTTLLQADLAKFTQAIQVNGLSLLYLVQKALPLLDRGSGIVFISSAGARTAQPNYGALGAGKALAESLVRYLVPELAPMGVRINAVAPGLVDTSSVADMVGGEDAALRVLERAARTNPSGRLSRDSDYAAVVEFLLSSDAEFVQGQVIHANGGAYISA
ncbi:MAG: SDR family oxidoreductase [Phenylobacterium sp.]|uniref:SDR family NAD(P)-dependent oxidoreductase n=1 Tax=Phenylobacterium sp. TaxID=1871053 RepID=UPI0027332170|nr:SDR family oxidoreductase [Phenylobacterium sp.]MDP3749000.1 SDR family oxidoreductase [Phenylobacterium sp.]